MKNRKEVQDELAKLSPFLSELKQEETGMKVPEHYFNFLTESVMEQVALIPKPASPALSVAQPAWYTFLFNKRMLGGLSMTLVLLMTVLFFRNQPLEESTIVEISSDEAAIYITAHLEDFETTLFTEGNFIEENFIEEELEEQEIDLYLNEIIEEVDIETLELLL